MDTVSRERESGEALNIRVAARTASLKQIALAGAFGLQQSLRQAAKWMGQNPEEVIVTPNLDFVDDNFMPADLVQLTSAKNMGAPISLRTIHDWVREKDVTALDFEEELRLIEEEASLSVGSSNEEDLDDDDEGGDDGNDSGNSDA